MKYLYFIILSVLFYSVVSAQNYETIKPESIVHFGNTIHSIKIDSTETSGDSLFYYNHKMIRYGINDCEYAFGGSWTGNKIIVMPNGLNIFLNKNYDSIKINTQADLYSSWILFKYQNGNYIAANVSDKDLETFIGITDSVKTISLQLKDYEGNNISDPINDKFLKISKNYGFVRIFNFYEFPEFENYEDWYYIIEEEMNIVGYDDHGYQNFGAKEIYDFYIGDEFHTYSENNCWTEYWGEDKQILKVIDKDSNENSIIYTYERCLRSNDIDYIYPENSGTNYKHDTITKTIDFTTDQMIFLSNISYNAYDLGDGWWEYLENTENSKRCGEAIFTSYEGECLNLILIDKSNSKSPGNEYKKGLGGPYYYFSGFNCTGSKNLTYYKKGTTTWGTPYSCSSLSSFSEISDNVNIYPIPAQNFINISFENNNSEKANIQIINITGQIVFQESLISNSSIDVSTFENGLYLVKISLSEKTVVRKIIISR
ncbi:MAG: T9SS type A sorting domain-containing protein [Bacteroidales bacterium]|nr:T9SS type A sorting domain-containing protein [Bacteroidales bacterium]